MKLSIILFASLFAPLAYADTVRIDDRAGVLGASASALAAETDRWPFDLKVITARYETTSDQDLEVHRCSDTPKVVCISIDTARKNVVLHFGWGSGVRPEDFDHIATAGKFLLKAGDWRSGIEAIADKAALSVVGDAVLPAAVLPPLPAPEMKLSHIEIENGWMIFVAALLTLAGLFLCLNLDEILSWWRRRI